MISKVSGRYIAITLKVTDSLPHIVPCSRGVSDTTKSLYFLPPLRRGALLQMLGAHCSQIDITCVYDCYDFAGV